MKMCTVSASFKNISALHNKQLYCFTCPAETNLKFGSKFFVDLLPYKDTPPILLPTGTILMTTARTKSLQYSFHQPVSILPLSRMTGEQRFISHVATETFSYEEASLLLCTQSSTHLGAWQERDGDADQGGQGLQRPMLWLPSPRGRRCHGVQFAQHSDKNETFKHPRDYSLLLLHILLLDWANEQIKFLTI